MAIPMWVPAAVKAGSSLLSYFTRKKEPRFETLPYAHRLQQLMKQGVYTPRYQQEVIGDVARTTGGLTQQAKAGYRGRLAKMGMLGSIAGAGKLAEFDTEHADRLSEASRKMAMANAQSKSEAATEYARLKTEYDQGQRERERQAKGELFGGLAGAAGSLASNLLNQQLLGARTAYYNRMGKKDIKPNVMGLIEAYQGGAGMSPEQFIGGLMDMGLNENEIGMLISQIPEAEIVASTPFRTDTSYRQRIKNMRTQLGNR